MLILHIIYFKYIFSHSVRKIFQRMWKRRWITPLTFRDPNLQPEWNRRQLVRNEQGVARLAVGKSIAPPDWSTAWHAEVHYLLLLLQNIIRGEGRKMAADD